MSDPRIINCPLNAKETTKFDEIKGKLGLRHDTEVFRQILKAYKVEESA